VRQEHRPAVDRRSRAAQRGDVSIDGRVVSGRTGTDPIFHGAADFDLELLQSHTLDGHIQELIYRPTLHV
jgi:hypothetical protein